MASVTIPLARISDSQVPPSYATVDLTYDDSQMFLDSVRVINETNQTMRVAGRTTDGQRSFTRDFAAGVDELFSLPRGQQQRLNISIDANGRLDGVDYSVMLV